MAHCHYTFADCYHTFAERRHKVADCRHTFAERFAVKTNDSLQTQTRADIEAIDIGSFSPARRDTFQTAETLDQRRCYSYPALRHSTTDFSFQKSQNSKTDYSYPELRHSTTDSSFQKIQNSKTDCSRPAFRNSMPIFPNLPTALSNPNSSNSEFLFLNLNWLISAFPYWKPRRWNRNCQRSESERLRRYFVPQNQQSVH